MTIILSVQQYSPAAVRVEQGVDCDPQFLPITLGNLILWKCRCYSVILLKILSYRGNE